MLNTCSFCVQGHAEKIINSIKDGKYKQIKYRYSIWQVHFIIKGSLNECHGYH